jgi:hypothetical protein
VNKRIERKLWAEFLGRLLALSLLAVLIPIAAPTTPAEAAVAKVSSFSPNAAKAEGGTKIIVKGTNLQNVSKVRIGGVIQSKLSSKTKSGFSFVMPKLSESTRKYGGFVKTEYFESGQWKSSSSKFLATASRTKAFKSAGLVYKLLETNQPGSIGLKYGYDDLVASPSASLYTVKLNVLNMSDDWIDLTCSFEVDVRVVDTTFKRFSSMGDSYEIAGNPECNDFMNPGFDADTLWAFNVPNRFKPVAIEVTTVTWSGPTPKTFFFTFNG